MRPNALRQPPVSAWALLDMLLAQVVRRWRAETEFLGASWSEAALALPPIAIRARVEDPALGGMIILDLGIEFADRESTAGQYVVERDRIELYPGAKKFRSHKHPSDEHLRSDLLTLLHHPFVHEYDHKRQKVQGQLPEEWPLHLRSKAMYLDRPWEQDAFAADIAYRLATTQPGTVQFSEARVRSYVLRELAKLHGTTEARDVIVRKVIELLRDTGWVG